MVAGLSGWRPALRIARREALRARGRSLLVLLMVALPVMGVVALDTLYRTADVSTAEGVDRQLGSADALVEFEGFQGPVQQSPTAQTFGASGHGKAPLASAGAVRAALGPRARVLRRRDGDVQVRTAAGVAVPAAVEVDLSDPMTRGLFRLTSGRVPRTADEVVVSGRLAARGFPVGSRLPVRGVGARTVVGTVESADIRDALLVVGPPGALGLASSPRDGTFLVDRPGGVSWRDVRAMNRGGMLVLSREVVADPPPDPLAGSGGGSPATLAVLALVAAMALIEVVLLAGPAFAVGARRQQRSLALLTATGARARDVRRTVLASGVVLGAAGAASGAVLGVGLAFAVEPLVQRLSDTWFGPFDVSARDVAGIAVLGLLSALLAALAPAWLASRADVVAVLAGRRGEGRPGRRSPVLGVLLLAAGVAGAVWGARSPGGETRIAAAAVATVLGMVLLVPLVVAGVGRVAARLPLSARYAVRDAARHRSRTAPAVAAVAASVAGVVALGIGASSDAAQNRATYTPMAPVGSVVISTSDGSTATWTGLERAVHRTLPAATITPVSGVRPETAGGDGLGFDFSGAGAGSGGWTSAYRASVLVAGGHAGGLGLRLDPAQARRADAVLARGGAVVLGQAPAGRRRTTLHLSVYDESTGDVTSRAAATLPAVFLTVAGTVQPVQAVLSPAAAARLHLRVRPAGLLVTGAPVDQQTEETLREAAAAVAPDSSVYVERGFSDQATAVVLLILGLAGGVLMVGGTLTATFLALSDARPDLATLAAVGAPPLVRRRVGAAYAGFIGLVGAALGVLVGLVPGIAVTFPLTSTSWESPATRAADGSALPSHFVDVPWLLVVAVVVLLPLLTAAVVGLASRSRLPMVARLS